MDARGGKLGLNVVRWWISLLVHAFFWFFRWRHEDARPDPKSAPRCRRGHLLYRQPDGRYDSCGSCSLLEAEA